jgi:glyoxylase-like metal-dependent hydrolase (beta-lactamase superfamily II)
LLLKAGNVLITGDAANISNGELIGANPKHTADPVKAEESFEKIKRLHPDFIVCYHSGLLRCKK